MELLAFVDSLPSPPDDDPNLVDRVLVIGHRSRRRVRESCIFEGQDSELENNDPVLSLERDLKLAVEEERYDDAARLRDEIALLKPPQMDPTSPDGGLQSLCKSTRTTEGVQVEVQSVYVPQHNKMTGGYMFAYKIHITNKAHPTTIKLVSRRWEITDAKGRVKIVEGAGVIGEQPELSPGETFTYQSVCPLETTTGRMKGHFEMYSRASPDSSWNTSFLVDVGEFQFDIDGPSTFE
eukprot:jgi/Picre1/28583/NNA_003985.t1